MSAQSFAKPDREICYSAQQLSHLLRGAPVAQIGRGAADQGVEISRKKNTWCLKPRELEAIFRHFWPPYDDSADFY